MQVFAVYAGVASAVGTESKEEGSKGRRRGSRPFQLIFVLALLQARIESSAASLEDDSSGEDAFYGG
jgi:hypothetical protein